MTKTDDILKQKLETLASNKEEKKKFNKETRIKIRAALLEEIYKQTSEKDKKIFKKLKKSFNYLEYLNMLGRNLENKVLLDKLHQRYIQALNQEIQKL